MPLLHCQPFTPFRPSSQRGRGIKVRALGRGPDEERMQQGENYEGKRNVMYEYA